MRNVPSIVGIDKERCVACHFHYITVLQTPKMSKDDFLLNEFLSNELDYFKHNFVQPSNRATNTSACKN